MINAGENVKNLAKALNSHFFNYLSPPDGNLKISSTAGWGIENFRSREG